MGDTVYYGVVAEGVRVSDRYVRTHPDYGEISYYLREDVRHIGSLALRTLNLLNKREKFGEKVRNRRVFVKPTLVAPWADDLYKQSPATYDPRVFEAVLAWLYGFGPEEIIVGESPCIGYPSRFVFRHTGLDKICKKLKARVVYLDEDSVVEVCLPNARTHKKVLLPESFAECIDEGGLYVSLPKLKTNVFSKVTLAIKNNIGLLQGRMRLMHHDHRLYEKLVDLLYIADPDLVVIDGIVLGHGQGCTIPKPYESRCIIAGTDEFSVDTVACEVMGVDPKSVELMKLACERGFGKWEPITILNQEGKKIAAGDIRHTLGRIEHADYRVHSRELRKKFPHVNIFVGYPGKGKESHDHDRGGNTSMIRHALFDYFGEEGLNDVQLHVVYGPGDSGFYYDSEGDPWSVRELKMLGGNMIAIGNEDFRDRADMTINEHPARPLYLHLAMHRVTGTKCRMVLHPGESHISHFLHGYTRNYFITDAVRRAVRMLKIFRGERLDTDEKHKWAEDSGTGLPYEVLGRPEKLSVSQRLGSTKDEVKELLQYIKVAYV